MRPAAAETPDAVAGPGRPPAPPGADGGGARRLGVAAAAGALAYMGTIFFLSSLSNPLPQLTELVWDKALHATEYAGLGALLTLALRRTRLRPRVAILLAVLATSAYGVTDELHQRFVPGRSCDVHDWMADTLGAIAGAVGAAVVLRVLRSRATIARARPRG